MRSHTPGPWVARLSTRIYDDTIVIDGPTKERVAVIPADDTTEIEDGAIVDSCSDEAKSNARLVTSAPKLLVALRSAERFLLDRAHLPNHSDFANVLRDVSAAIDEAGR